MAMIDCCTREIVAWQLELSCRADEAIALVERGDSWGVQRRSWQGPRLLTIRMRTVRLDAVDYFDGS